MIAKHFQSLFPKSFLTHRHSLNAKSITYSFATRDSPLDSKQKIEFVRKQSWFQDYQTASKYNSERKYPDALKYYYKVIQTMEEKNQKGQAYYYRMFNKVLKINVLLNRPLQTQENLYKLIKVKKTPQKNPILVYEDYQNLMIHQLDHNVDKAIKLGKALLSESQINHLPITNEKSIRMLLGNAYLLVDNYPDAKKKYGEVIEMNPSHLLRGKTLNNLGIACWWHKNPTFPLQSQQGPEYEEMRLNRDFKQTKQLLLNSIGALENIDELSEKQAVALQSLLNQNPQSLLALSSKSTKQNSSVYSIQHREVLQPIYNLIQYYIYNDPIQKPLILAWMRILLKTASKFQAQELADEITAKYHLLNGDVNELKTLLKSHHAKNQQSSKTQTIQQTTNPLMSKLHLLQLYKMMSLVNRVSPSTPVEFNIDQQKINTLQNQLLQKDPFIFKRQFIMSDEMSFMKADQ